jgi:two-component system response regulator YesN
MITKIMSRVAAG